jgi:hypothetical protein
MNKTERDDRDCLSDAHREFLSRYMEQELRRAEQVAKRLLRERSAAVAPAIKSDSLFIPS